MKGHREIAVGGHNIKIGRGGIREIEFFAQTQQLILGGRVPELRQSGTCAALRALAEQRWVKPEVAEELVAAYRFLRELEHRLQMVADRQTQESRQRPRIAGGDSGSWLSVRRCSASWSGSIASDP